MARLPVPGSDSGNWGNILNDFLVQAHNTDGTLKPGAITKSTVGLGDVDNTSDTDKPVSTATQTALDEKTPTSRTVNGHALTSDVTVTKADVGLGSVDNTSDTDKVASGPIADALGHKAESGIATSTQTLIAPELRRWRAALAKRDNVAPKVTVIADSSVDSSNLNFLFEVWPTRLGVRKVWIPPKINNVTPIRTVDPVMNHFNVVLNNTTTVTYDTTNMTDIEVLWDNGSPHTLLYSFDGATPVAVPSGSVISNWHVDASIRSAMLPVTGKSLAITCPSGGAGEFDGSNVWHYGIRANVQQVDAASPGYIDMSVLAVSGITAQTWAGWLGETGWGGVLPQSYIKAFDANLTIVVLGANDSDSRTTTQFEADLNTVIDRIQAITPESDIALCTYWAGDAGDNIWPDDFQPIIRSVAASRGAAILDIDPDMINYNTNPELFFDLSHLNTEGHLLARDVVAPVLLPEPQNPLESALAVKANAAAGTRIVAQGGDINPADYVELARLPIDDTGNFASLIITGRIGGWISANMAYWTIMLSNRDGLQGAVTVNGAASVATTLADIQIYTQGDDSAIVYIRRFAYYAYDFTVKTLQAQTQVTYTGMPVTPVGSLEWSLSSTAKLSVSPQGAVTAGHDITANRPNAVDAGQGAQFYDTTLGIPIWSDGTVWRDAVGNPA